MSARAEHPANRARICALDGAGVAESCGNAGGPPVAGAAEQPQREQQLVAMFACEPVFRPEALPSSRYCKGLIVSAIIRTATRP